MIILIIMIIKIAAKQDNHDNQDISAPGQLFCSHFYPENPAASDAERGEPDAIRASLNGHTFRRASDDDDTNAPNGHIFRRAKGASYHLYVSARLKLWAVRRAKGPGIVRQAMTLLMRARAAQSHITRRKLKTNEARIAASVADAVAGSTPAGTVSAPSRLALDCYSALVWAGIGTAVRRRSN